MYLHLEGSHEFNCCVPILVFNGERECFMAMLYVGTQLYLVSNMNACRRIWNFTIETHSRTQLLRNHCMQFVEPLDIRYACCPMEELWVC
jgi:hypothetical protein